MHAIKGIFQDLPGIIEKAASEGHRDGGDIYDQELPAKCPRLWPSLTELQPFTEATFSHPGKKGDLQCPVLKVDGTDH